MLVSKERNLCHQRGKEMVLAVFLELLLMKILLSRSTVLSLSVPLVRVKLGPILIETLKGQDGGGAVLVYFTGSLKAELCSALAKLLVSVPCSSLV